MKVLLLMTLVMGNGSKDGHTQMKEFWMPDMAHCESISEHLREIYSVDPAFENVQISTQCVEFPK